MQCDDGCGECCGPVPVTAREWGILKRYMDQHAIEPHWHKNQLTCPLYDGQRCMVHPARPLLCRVFGHSEHLECPRGYNRNISDARIAAAVRASGPACGLLPALLREDGR